MPGLRGPWLDEFWPLATKSQGCRRSVRIGLHGSSGITHEAGADMADLYPYDADFDAGQENIIANGMFAIAEKPVPLSATIA